MQRLRFLAFKQSLPQEEAEILARFGVNLAGMSSNQNLPQSCVGDTDFAHWENAFKAFVEQRRQENPTFDFWSKYIDMVQILLLFIRATRTS